jgi:mannose-6-phosphate isomerase-like protein (cupin superfamily)
MADDEAVLQTVLDAGAGGLVRRRAGVPAGTVLAGTSQAGGELWFVLAGTGRLAFGDGRDEPVRADCGVWLPPGTDYELLAEGTEVTLDCTVLPAGRADEVTLDCAAVPADGLDEVTVDCAGAPDGTAGEVSPDYAAPDFGNGSVAEGRRGAEAGSAREGGSERAQVRELAGCPVEVTGDRTFRVLFGPGRGCAAATQFAGEIPPGRAPEHTHPYDEVVLILAGEGVLHTGAGDRPLAPGSCVHLPPGLPHCLENTGAATLRVLGVFHPGDSPATKS